MATLVRGGRNDAGRGLPTGRALAPRLYIGPLCLDTCKDRSWMCNETDFLSRFGPPSMSQLPRVVFLRKASAFAQLKLVPQYIRIKIIPIGKPHVNGELRLSYDSANSYDRRLSLIRYQCRLVNAGTLVGTQFSRSLPSSFVPFMVGGTVYLRASPDSIRHRFKTI